MSHGFAPYPYGARETGWDPIGARKLEKGMPRTQDQIVAALAASHVTPAALAEVVTVDFRSEEEDVDFAPAAEQAM